MRSLFLETSALLRIIFDEEGAAETEERLSRAEWVVASRLLRIEAERALLRVVLDDPRKEKMLPRVEHELKDLWARVTFIDITTEICDLAGRIAPRSRLRSLDAIHLATFRTLKRVDPALEILTYDTRLLAEI